MSEDTDRVKALLDRLDRFLALFGQMLGEQRALNERDELESGRPLAAGAALLEQMLYARTVLEDRRRDLRASYVAKAAKVFISELWSLGGDMPHLDFDMSHLIGADALMALREEISLEALLLTRDLNDAVRMAALMRDRPSTTDQSEPRSS